MQSPGFRVETLTPLRFEPAVCIRSVFKLFQLLRMRRHTAVQTVFAEDADIIIVSCDDVQLRVASSQLARSWPSFGAFVTVVAAFDLDGVGWLVVRIKSHSIVIEPLLQLAHGLHTPALEEREPRALACLAQCAREYNMPGAEQALIIALRARLAVPHRACTRDYLEILTGACELGIPDMAQEAERRLVSADLDGQNFETMYRVPRDAYARLMRARSERVEAFSRGLADESPDGVFVYEHRGICRHCRRAQHPDVAKHWRQFVAALTAEFERHPSIDGAAACEHVQRDIRTLARDCCPHCGRVTLPWARLRIELLSLVDTPSSATDALMWL